MISVNDRQVSGPHDPISALRYAAAPVGVVVLAHTALREGVAVVEVTYLEHCYILRFVLVPHVIIAVFPVVRYPSAVLIRYRSHPLPKFLYWPIVSLLFLLSMLTAFGDGSPS